MLVEANGAFRELYARGYGLGPIMAFVGGIAALLLVRRDGALAEGHATSQLQIAKPR
jgi:hypothetical protein